MELKTFISFLFFAASALYLALPFFRKGGKKEVTNTGHHLDDLLIEKEEAVAGLNELDLDYRMKKLSEKEYRQNHQELKAREQILTQEIENESKTKVKGKNTKKTPMTAQAKFCFNCGAKLVPGAKFCSECGTKVA